MFCNSGPAFAATAPIPDGKPHQFALAPGQFLIDGKPFKIVAGEMHPVRVLPEFWEDRIKKARAMGLNTVSIYVMWNRIEVKEGTFDFTGINDIRRFAKLCQENGLWMIVRPGPYIGAEWDWGGFPVWLRTKEIKKLRGEDPVCQECFRRYITKVGEQLADLQIHRGGPILMVQVENEYRKIVDHYMDKLVPIFRGAGFDGQLFSNGLFLKSVDEDVNVPDLLYAIDGMAMNKELLAKSREVSSKKGHPDFCPENYTAWYSHWGKKVNRKPISSELSNLKWFFENNVSFCYYVFHGGTNFGYGPEATCITSYDYDAPVDEVGRITPKYLAIREYLTKALALEKLPSVPPDPKVIEVAPFTVARRCALLDSVVGQPVKADKPIDFEHLGVAGGFVLYRTRLEAPVNGVLEIPRLHNEYAVVMVDGAAVGIASDYYNVQHNSVQIHTTKPATLDILMQNCGRGRPAIEESIGLLPPTLAGKTLTGWEMFPLPLENPSDLPTRTAPEGSPVFYTGTFNLKETGETFLDLSKFGYGFVWVNGHNLGRYWEVGATRSLYLPSPWQKVGENRITVLDLTPRAGTTAEIKGTKNMIETEPIPFPAPEKK